MAAPTTTPVPPWVPAHGIPARQQPATASLPPAWRHPNAPPSVPKGGDRPPPHAHPALWDNACGTRRELVPTPKQHAARYRRRADNPGAHHITSPRGTSHHPGGTLQPRDRGWTPGAVEGASPAPHKKKNPKQKDFGEGERSRSCAHRSAQSFAELRSFGANTGGSGRLFSLGFTMGYGVELVRPYKRLGGDGMGLAAPQAPGRSSA